MTLFSASRSLRKGLLSAVVAAMGLAAASCDSAIFDDQGDCSVHYKVAFSYTMNMAFAEAFPRQVKDVTLYVVDKNGNIVAVRTDKGAALAEPGYKMDIEVLPGTYDLLVWATGESPVGNNTAFIVGNDVSPKQISQLSASLPLSGTLGSQYVDKDITPLFHGLKRSVNFPDTYGDVTVATVDLTKDTHLVQVALQSLDGTAIDNGEFSFYITGDNSLLSYTNEVVVGNQFEYRPWHVTNTDASFGTSKADNSSSTYNGMLAEFTTGRLMANSEPELVVHRKSDNTDVIRIDLLSYLLMVKGEYNRKLSDQEYLDCSDTFTLMFFIDSDRNWYTAAGIFINGWRIVPPHSGTL